MNTWPPITRDDLKEAAKRAGFDTIFPDLLRRLILETGDGITRIDMPGGSGTAAGGFDGIVTAEGKTAFVPAGTSVWELSIGGATRGKPDDDYNKRLDAPDNLPTSEVTYIEAILEPWTKAREWATGHQEDGRWREVRGYNLDRLQAWLETAPATMAWLAEHIGKRMPGLRLLDEWWVRTWLPSTRMPLTAEVVLAGRLTVGKELIERLTSGETWTNLAGDLRFDEVKAVVAAALQGGNTGVEVLRTKTIVADDEASLARLTAHPWPLIILVPDARIARELPTGHPHQLLVPVRATSDKATIEVARVHAPLVRDALAALGAPTDEAQRLAALSRGSFPALRRALAVHPDTLTPSWSNQPDRVCRRMLLLGAWNIEVWRTAVDEKPGYRYRDADVATELLSLSIDELTEAAGKLEVDDTVPFLGSVGDVWHVVAPDDAWNLIRDSLTSADLDAAREVFLEVLVPSTPDDTEEGERHRPRTGTAFSGVLRQSIGQSLVLAAMAEPAHGKANLGSWSVGIVREVFARANGDESYRIWLSLTDVLTLLAEAAPEELLRALRPGLHGDAPVHRQMFTDGPGSDLFGGSSAHSSFLSGPWRQSRGRRNMSTRQLTFLRD